MATPNPIRAKAITEKDCSLIINNTKIIVKARKPGISLMLCKIPISTPVKFALSTTKLFNKADHPLKAIGVAIDININIKIGELWKKDFFMILQRIIIKYHKCA